MSYCHGKEWNKFQAEQCKMEKEYRRAGMNEAQIREMYQFDLGVFNRERAFREHIQERIKTEGIDTEEHYDLWNCLVSGCEKIEDNEGNKRFRYWWLEELEDTTLQKKLSTLVDEDKELLTLYFCEQYTQTEIAEIMGISQRGVSKRIQRIKRELQKP